jgi:Flp pilus assembly protein TadG
MKRLRRDDGMVTAELATALPVLVLLALVAVMIVGLAQARVRCADAAREAARAIARGDPAAADGVARAAAGHPIAIHEASGPERTTVTVSLTLHSLSWLGPITVTETAVVATEPVP